ncbi:ATP-dependent DNA helicase [Peribacillus sp. B-H-3]|uniref:ATP-dependent DNA helicase n=1 Tax=Peribacillus sp. B-H-3 TaxID=3400420 RepID=UPI003B015520
MKNYKVSVRTLAEYVYKSGSITSGFRAAASLSEGTRIHQKIQKQYGEHDLKEVPLTLEHTYEDIVFFIEGRCDGLLADGHSYTIDEIKSTALDLHTLSETNYPVHWAQAKCYAAMFALHHNLDEIGVQLTYVQKNTEEIKRFKVNCSRQELAAFLEDMMKGFYHFANWKLEHLEERNKACRDLSFPFENYRGGQRKLAGAVYKTINEKANLFANAPTGIGKTASTIFPSLKIMGQGECQKIFYLTAKTITRQTAEDTFSLMMDRGLVCKTVTITAKDKICFHDNGSCNPNECEFANGYYDRVNNAMLDILEHEQLITRSVIEEYAKKHKLCPFEFSLDLAYVCDAVVCDYNYVFDPRVSLKRMLDEQKKDTVLLVDEAHNLVDRARSMFSAELYKTQFLQIKRENKLNEPAISRAAKNINRYFIEEKKSLDNRYNKIMQNLPDDLLEGLEAFIEAAEPFLLERSGGVEHEDLLQGYFDVQNFLKISKLVDEHYSIYFEIQQNDAKVKLFCLNPSTLLKNILSGFCSAILFSATLSPAGYFMDMLGGGEEDYRISVPSPFTADQNEVLISRISTRYRDREESIDRITDLLINILDGRKGNYLVFFPSHQYMNNVYGAFTAASAVKTIIQGSTMTEDEREDFLNSFQENKDRLFVGFAVLGGIFSEGVDMKGDRLSGVIITGVGLPQIGFERDIIKSHFQDQGKNGYDYAYVFPGMNKVLQAGGRLIRSEEDHGLIVLVDDRFLTAKYQGMLPENWGNYNLY